MAKDPEALTSALKEQVRLLRQQGRVPTEVLLGQEAWNLLRYQMSYGSLGTKRVVLLEGLPCSLAFGVPAEPGFVVRSAELKP